jgi:hypothetical protein
MAVDARDRGDRRVPRDTPVRAAESTSLNIARTAGD